MWFSNDTNKWKRNSIPNSLAVHLRVFNQIGNGYKNEQLLGIKMEITQCKRERESLRVRSHFIEHVSKLFCHVSAEFTGFHLKFRKAHMKSEQWLWKYLQKAIIKAGRIIEILFGMTNTLLLFFSLLMNIKDTSKALDYKSNSHKSVQQLKLKTTLSIE